MNGQTKPAEGQAAQGQPSPQPQPAPGEPAQPPQAPVEKVEVSGEPSPKPEKIDAFFERFIGERRPRRAAPAKPPEKPKAQPQAKQQKEANEPPVLDAAQAVGEIAKAVAAGVASGLQQQVSGKAEQPKKDEKPPDPLEGLDEEDRKTVEVLQRMEKAREDYKGLSERYVRSLKAALEYKAKWEKEHPDEEFDPEAEEHAEFFAKNDVDWDEDDYVRALAELEAERIAERKLEKAREEIKKVKAEIQEKEAAPNIKAAQSQAAKKMLETIDKRFDVLTDTGDIDQTKLAKVYEEDPVNANIVFQAADALEKSVAELERLSRGLVEFDQKNPLHTALAEVITAEETRIASLPPEKRMRDGKLFLPGAQYEALPQDQKARFWRLTPADIESLIADQFAGLAKRQIEANEQALRKIAQRRGWLKSDEEEKEQAKRQATEEMPFALRPATPVATPPPMESPVGFDRKPAVSKPATFLERFLK
jgi:hypothetical protein